MSWVTIIRGKDISKHAEGGAGSGILLTSATPLHASLVCGTSTMARTAGERHFRIASLNLSTRPSHPHLTTATPHHEPAAPTTGHFTLPPTPLRNEGECLRAEPADVHPKRGSAP